MLCPFCGNPVPSRAKACPACGTIPDPMRRIADPINTNVSFYGRLGPAARRSRLVQVGGALLAVSFLLPVLVALVVRLLG